MSRVLFFGDLAATGFGTVTIDLGRELLNLGHDVRFVSSNEVEGTLPEPFGSRTWQLNDPSLFVPELAEEFEGTQGLGLTVLALKAEGYAGFFNGRLWKDEWKPEMAIIVGDPGNIRLMVMRDEMTRAAFAMVPVLHYVPIEGVDLPPLLTEMWKLVKPVAMSEFGAGEIQKLTGTRPPMVYHGVDTEVFRPATPERPLYEINQKTVRSKEDAKRALGMPKGARLIFRADRNMPRKRYASFLRAMGPVLASRPDLFLVMHCQARDLGGDMYDWLSKWPEPLRGKWDPDAYFGQGAFVGGRAIVTNARIERNLLTAFYNAADLYVSSCAEGFGLTLAEAMACGTPAVGIDYSSVPEVIGPGGAVVPIDGLVDNEYGYFWAAANERALSETTAKLIDDPAQRRMLARAGREHVMANFSWAKAGLLFSGLIREAVESEVAA